MSYFVDLLSQRQRPNILSVQSVTRWFSYGCRILMDYDFFLFNSLQNDIVHKQTNCARLMSTVCMCHMK